MKFVNTRTSPRGLNGNPTNEDRIFIKNSDEKNNMKKFLELKKEEQEEKVKKLILCKGQIFGEDECLNLVYNHG